MLRKTAKLLIATLILLELSIIAIATLPTRMTTVEAALENDMPVVFVDPLNSTANVGETFTISVKVFNVSGKFYTTEVAWEEGEPLPPLVPSYWRYNYSLGHLYAFDLRLKWDPTILDYVSHTVTVPVEEYADGVLHEPIIEIPDIVDPDVGTYVLTRSSQTPALAFNAPDENATFFNMTFRVKSLGKCDISFTNVDLVVDLVGLGMPFSVPHEIPHGVKNGRFQTGELLTRVESVQAGALVAGSILAPVIEGEDVTVKIAMKNDNDTMTDTYNLSLYEGTMLLNKWENEELDPDATKIFTYTIEGLGLGLHTVKADAEILHGGETRTSELSRNLTVVDTPSLEINGLSSTTTAQTVSFSASGSVHNDPNGNITAYRWSLWAPGDPGARATETGESVSFTLPPQTEKIGNWTVMLVVEDNYGITAKALSGTAIKPTSELLRPAAAPYRKIWTLNVQEAAPLGLNIEWIVLIVVLIVVIAVAVFYIRRRQR